MADNEQTQKGSDEKQSSPPASGVQPADQTKPEGAGTKPVALSEPARSATGATQPTPPPPSAVTVPKRRYLGNLGLSVALVISVTFWFLRHMEHLFTGALIGGTLVTFLMALQIGYSAFKWGAEEEIRSIPTKLLGAPASRKWIIILLIASLGLHLFTSSLYLENTSADSSQDYTVEIVDAGSDQPFVPPMSVTADDKVAGKLFFFRLRATKLRFTLTEPRGYEPKIERFGLGSAILLRTPADFARKQFHILRVVFGPRLWTNLAESNDATAVTGVSYDLQISMGGSAIQIDDVRRQTIDVGASYADIEAVLRKEDSVDRRSDFGARLAAMGIPTEVQQRLIDAWESNHRVCPTAEHSPGEALTVSLRRRGTEAPLAHQETTMTSATIQTIVLEMP